VFEAPKRGMCGLLPAPVGVRNWVEYFLFSMVGFCHCHEGSESDLMLAMRDESGDSSTVVAVEPAVGLSLIVDGGVGKPGIVVVVGGRGFSGEGGPEEDEG